MDPKTLPNASSNQIPSLGGTSNISSDINTMQNPIATESITATTTSVDQPMTVQTTDFGTPSAFDAPVQPQTPSQNFPPAPSDFTTEGLSAPLNSPPPSSVFADSTTTQITDTTLSTSPVDPMAPLPPTNADPSAFATDPSPVAMNQQPQPDPFAPLAPVEPPADTAMATDPLIPNTPVTPYNTQMPQVASAASTPLTQPLPSPSEVVQANTPHETSALTKVIYIIAAVIFFAVYTIFWIKVFNLPFLF